MKKKYKPRFEITTIGRYKANIGKKIGVLKVLDVIRKVDEVRNQTNIVYVVQCDCGNKRDVLVSSLHCKAHSRCGCDHSKKIKGKRYAETIQTAFLRAKKSSNKDHRAALLEHEKIMEKKLLRENVYEVWEAD